MLRQILSQKTAPSESIDSSKRWDHVIHTIVYDSYVDLQTDQTTCGIVCECVYIIYIIHIILHNIIYIHVLIGLCMLEWNVRIMYTILWFNGSNLLFETISEMMFHPFYLLALLKKWTTQSPLSSYLRVHPANCIWWATLIVSLHILWLSRIRIYHWLRVVVANELLHWKTPTPYQCHPPPAIRFCWPPATCEWLSSIYSIRFSVSLWSTSTILNPFAARSVLKGTLHFAPHTEHVGD